ncbi:MAG: hypothetical protein NVS1B7_5710 [Candidatus Saccharimonadales bacterium]
MSLLWPILWVIVIVGFTAFTFVILFGAPFLPTLGAQVPKALDLIDMKPGETLIELGSGDGRVLLAAAERGLNAIGYELNPFLVIYSRIKVFKYRKQIKIIWGNFWNVNLPECDGIFVFLLQPYMNKLDKKIIQECSKPVKLVSFAFTIPEKKVHVRDKGMFLYKY